ncbi:hypothetical protein CQW49_13220 [Methylosinus trichosporium OB3b]|uniref:Uncharacterized protein n=2 Tax=Methylocystaceae TaxID=31993 RepID=A0A2D2D160_METT3|nr:hypothetical protein CQW49_13220 [Methylosinus trichosporium OB3b]OBS53106.1 hypothetical protein A8B73_07295 [Methylosinus sp. 3S-1]
MELCKALGFGPDYMNAPAFGKVCFALGVFFVSLPFTLAVNHYAPILKEKQRAARRRRVEQDFADHVRERGLILAARHQLPRGRD